MLRRLAIIITRTHTRNPPADARDVKGLAAIVALDERDHLRHGLALLQQPPHAHGGLQPQRDLRVHVRQLLLHQLIARQRRAELLPVICCCG